MIKIPVNTPLLDGNEKAYLLRCIDDGWISSEGPFVSEFEVKMAQRFDRNFGVSCANGSAALDIAVAAADIGANDEVIMPAFTIISPALSVVRAGATPVLVDSDKTTWNMDVTQVEAKITSRTKAVLAVHIYGLPIDMAPLLDLCQKYGLLLIEDAAEMHGQTYNGKPCGSFGDISVFSFYPNKHITTGEGGMLLTNSEEISQRCKSFRNLCFLPQRRFVHEELGWNYRMTNLQAALGVAQLESLDRHIIKKREIGSYYIEKLTGISNFQLPLPQTEYAENIYWVFGIVAKSEHLARAMVSGLEARGIGTRPFFWPMHLQPAFRKRGLFDGESYPVAEELGKNGFYIPSGLGLSDDELRYVCDSVLALV